jgi:hypothetical protein
MVESAFPQTQHELARRLAASEAELQVLADRIESVYKCFWRRDRGKRRWIEAPSEPLKAVQRRIAKLLQPLLDSEIAFGVTGRGFLEAAQVHNRAPWSVRFDIENFFPSIRCAVIESTFIRLGVAEECMLLRLTTFRGRLPQGAPSSSRACKLFAGKTRKEKGS